VGNEEILAPSLNLNLSCYPNPFHAYTNIKVSAPDPGRQNATVHSADIAIYNIKGQHVKSISLDPEKSGEQFAHWDGRHADNSRCASGIYFINLRVNGRNVSSRKVTFIR
jgi:flagellar hook assembly protein FlgD